MSVFNDDDDAKYKYGILLTEFSFKASVRNCIDSSPMSLDENRNAMGVYVR